MTTEKSTLFLPSLMCADFGHLREDVLALEAAGADGFHLDLMDGNYVPNYAMGLGDIQAVASMASVPCDVHMMVQDPGRYVDRFAKAGVRIVYVHPDACPDCAATLRQIRELGMAPGIAVNPGVTVEEVRELLSLVDYVLAMTVNPGFAGQKWIASVDPKIAELSKLGESMGFDVIIDGNCSPENIKRAHDLGARGFVLGTAGLFGHGPYRQTMAALRGLFSPAAA